MDDVNDMDEEELNQRIAEAKERHIRAENELAKLVRRLQMNALQQRAEVRFHQQRGHHAIMADAPPSDAEDDAEIEENDGNGENGRNNGDEGDAMDGDIRIGDAGEDNLDEVQIHLTFQEIIRLQNLSDEVI